MATYVNDLRLKEIATGDESGTWGTSTNTNLELIAEAFSFGTEAITTNADTHTTTIADGSTDPGRSIFLKYTGTLDSACTITIGPNTVSKLWLIENATSGSQTIIIKQGSGATITVPNGQTKAIYSDGAGSGGAMVDAFQDLSIPDLFIDDDLTIGDDLVFSSDSAVITFGADGDTTLTHTDGTGLTLNSTNKLTFGDVASFVQQSSDGVLRVDGEATIDLNASTAVTVSNDLKLDSDSAVLGFGADNDTTLTHTDGSGLTLNSTNKIMFNDASQFIQGSSATVLSLGATDEIDLTATLIDINGNADVSGTVTATGTSVFASLDISGDIDVDGTTNLDVVDIDGALTQDGGAVFNEASADVDFRVETNAQTHGFFLDASTNNAGFSVTPITGNLASFNSVQFGQSGIIQTAPATSFISVNDNVYRASSGSTGYKAINTGASSLITQSSGQMDFYTNASASAGADVTLSARMAIFSDGDVGIGETDTSGYLAPDLVVVAKAQNGGITVKSSSTSHAGTLAFADANSGTAAYDGYIQYEHNNRALTLASAGVERLRLGESEAIFNDGSGDYDFRVESDADANAFFVNGGDGVVSFGGMGTNTRSPSAVQPKLQANSLTRMDSSISLCCNSNDALASLLMFSKTRSGNLTGATAAQAGDAVGAITWNAADGTDIEHGIAAIDAVVESGIGSNDTPGAIRFYTNSGTTSASERVRINGTGDLQVATTDTTLFSNTSGGGINLMAANRLDVARNGDVVQTLNRMSSDGSILQFYMRGARCGDIVGIGTDGMAFAAPSDGGAAIIVTGNANIIYPARNSSGTIAASDNTIDLGASGVRFNDAFITNGVTTGSDRNLKQDIEELSDAEKRVAVACKSLLRKWRWKDAVEEKGDDARIHIGIIAQDLQDAFTAEGLDAARYGMFCSDTWWEAQTEVAAKEATETSPAIEAHTRTDRFDTAEEAPEGAVQCTRLSVRYSELLAFIISAI